MASAPYNMVGLSISLYVGWGGPKSMGGMVFSKNYLVSYCLGKSYPYMGKDPL